MRQYRIIALTDVPGEDGDYTLDGAHYTDNYVELVDSPDLDDVMAALKEVGALAEHATADMLFIHEEDNTGSLTVRQREGGRWLWELRPETSHWAP